MLAVCPICVSKFVSTSDDITATPCGHTFHYACILQWLQTSKSCPHCRNKTTEKSLLKLFFDVQSDSTVEDIGSIQNQNDSLKFQITLRDKELKNARDDRSKAEKQTKLLRDEIHTSNDKLKAIKTMNAALKMQVKYLNDNAQEVEDAKKKLNLAETQLKRLELVKKIYSDNRGDIENIINDCSSQSNMQESLYNLATISNIMQKKLDETIRDKCKFAEESLVGKRKLKEVLKNSSVKDIQIESLKKHSKLLKEDISSLEKENISLTKKVSALRDSIISPSGNVKNKVINRLLTESVVPENFRMLNDCDTSIPEDFITPEVIRTKPQSSMIKPLEPTKVSPVIISKPQSSMIKPLEPTKLSPVSNYPYIRLKSSSVNPFATYNSKNPEIINKKAASSPIISKSKHSLFKLSPLNDDFGYDGLGGHHRADNFPVVKKLKRVNIVNKGKCNSAQVIQVQKINDYFKNTFDE